MPWPPPVTITTLSLSPWIIRSPRLCCRNYHRSCVCRLSSRRGLTLWAVCYRDKGMLAAVVLSAGESSRMGRPKALLPLGESFFLERIVNAFQATKIGKIFVVLGHNAAALEAAVKQLPVSILVNRDYTLGQLSSLHVALRALEKEPVDGIALH